MFKRFYLTCCILVISMNTPFAAQPKWVSIGNNKEGESLLDVNNIVSHELLVRVWTLFNYNAPKYNAMSFKQGYEINCKEMTYKAFEGYFYKDTMADGEVVFMFDKSDTYIPIMPGTFIDKINDYVCKNK